MNSAMNMKRIAAVTAVLAVAVLAMAGAACAAVGDYPGSGTVADPWWCGADVYGMGHPSNNVVAWYELENYENAKLDTVLSYCLHIKGHGDMYDFSENNPAPWNQSDINIYSSKFISKLVIEGDEWGPLTSIGDYAFSGVVLYLPKDKSSEEHAMTIEIPEGVVRIGTCAFDFVNPIGYTAKGGTIRLVIPETVEEMEGAFSNIVPLRTIELGSNPYFIQDDLGAVYSVDGVTGKEKTLIYLPGQFTDTPVEEGFTYVMPDSLERIGDYAFSGVKYNAVYSKRCTVMTGIELKEGLKSIGNHAFDKVTSLEKIALPSTVEDIGDRAFNYCTKISELNIPDNVRRIGDFAFYGTSISELNIPASVEKIGIGALIIGGDHGECITTVSPENRNFQIIDHHALVSADGTEFIRFVFDSKETASSLHEEIGEYTIPAGVTRIGDYAFSEAIPSYDDTLTIHFPESVKVVGKYAFAKVISDEYHGTLVIDMKEGVEEIGDCAFGNNRFSLKSISLPDTVSKLGIGVFFGCGDLISVKLPAGIKEIPDGTFRSCESLTISFLPDTVEKIGDYAFANCGGKDSSVLTIPSSVREIGNHAFENYAYTSEGVSIILEEGLQTIGDEAFIYSAGGIASVNIPSTVETIGQGAFAGFNVGSITVADGNTHFKLDDYGVLYTSDMSRIVRCPTQIDCDVYILPSTVKQIDDYAFYRVNPGDWRKPIEEPAMEIVLNEGLEVIGNHAFEMAKIKSGSIHTYLTIPASVRKIGDSAFWSFGFGYDQGEGDFVFILEDGSVLEEIGDNAFYCCPIKKLVLPSSMKKIGSKAFMYGPLVTVFEGNVDTTSIFADSFMHYEEDDETIYKDTAYVTEGTLDKKEFPYVVYLNGGTLTEVPVPATVEDYHKLPNPETVTRPNATFKQWYILVDGEKVPYEGESIEFGNPVYAEWNIIPEKKGSTTTSFGSSSKVTDGMVHFDRAVVVTDAYVPGASDAKITNTSGDGWYNFTMTASGFTGNGWMNFQVPLDVFKVKNAKTGDVGLYHQENGGWVLKPTTYLNSDNQYAYYKAVIDSCSPFKIDFRKDTGTQESSSEQSKTDSTEKTVEKTVTEEKKVSEETGLHNK